MAEIVVSAFLDTLLKKLVSVDLMKLARSEGIDPQLNKWKQHLPVIQAALADAGQKQITQNAVKLWLHELQDLAYDIDDLLDDMATEVMKRKFQRSHPINSTSKLLKIIPTCCTNYTPLHNIMYGRQMSSRLNEVTTKLNDLVDQKNILSLDVNENVERNKPLEQTSVVDVSKVMGREGDKEALLGKLLGNESCNQNVSIVSIVGLGGIGKTTLAKVLYNDEKVKAHFELKAWVCVSRDFDVFHISKVIFQAVGGEDTQFASLDLLHKALQEKLHKKKFLLVLDDVWNENQGKSECLQSPFVEAACGSKIIITTRNRNVAEAMSSFPPYNLKGLSDEKALSIFAKCALNEENFDKHPSLGLIAQRIIQKCHGLPLHLITLGRVLKTKGRSDDEWREILNSEIWNIQDESGILPALKISYYDLPSHLKQLFEYCSLFPKGYELDKNELVLLWMAEGFLSRSMDNKSMENLGRQYFKELQSRTFFEHSTNLTSRYTMHDLMNDLAISVAGEFLFMLDDKTDVNGGNEAFEKFRHFSFIGQRYASYTKFKELHRARRLRTFIPVSIGWEDFENLDSVLVQVLPELQFLRVLSLTNFSIREVPQSIGSLKHLRYLHCSRTFIESLPEQVSDLYNLQSLLVRDCSKLSSLPVSFVKLTNLRHLDITDTPLLNKTPLGIGELMSLQTLPKVFIEGGDGFKISELKGLLYLQGRLSIKGLDKVTDPIQAKDAKLQQKTGLDDLDMEWSDVFDDSRKPMIEYEVLKWLRPHSRLKTLKILFYGGMKFPRWVGDFAFDQLTKLTLEGCRSSTHLPTLGHLKTLQKLFLRSMSVVKTVGFELLAPTEPIHGNAFPALDFLEVSDMRALEIWSTSGGDYEGTARSFPFLRHIYIKHCPKLAEMSIGLIPSLEVLCIEGCSKAALTAIAGVSSSNLRLTMKDITGLTQLHGDYLKHLGAVEYLCIKNCDELKYLWKSELKACKFLVRLKKLEVHGCKKLVLLGKEKDNVGSSMDSPREVTLSDCETLKSYICPNSVERLVIYNCSSMTSVTFSTLQDSKLRYLEIRECKNLNSFPLEHLESHPTLEEVWVYGCPRLGYSVPRGLWPPSLRDLR